MKTESLLKNTVNMCLFVNVCMYLISLIDSSSIGYDFLNIVSMLLFNAMVITTLTVISLIILANWFNINRNNPIMRFLSRWP